MEDDGNIPHRGPDDGVRESTLPQHRSTLKRDTTYRSFAPNISNDEMEKLLDDAEHEGYQHKTWSRIFVENFLQKYSWYWPGRESDKEDAPKLSRAWAYYEHITLARRFVGEQTADHSLVRAEPGQRDDPDKGITTELYSPWTTPEASLNEWGLGVAVYFTTLRVMSVILLIAGLINIANIVQYSSFSYSGDKNVTFTQMGSAICTDAEFVRCYDCLERKSDWDTKETGDLFATDANGHVFVRRNYCKGAELEFGIVNWITLLVLIILTTILMLYLRLRETRFDEDKITATDYSVAVMNPPPDAINPDEWHQFFSQFSEKQVTVVTIALNNDQLVRKLIARRMHRDNLRRCLPKGFADLDDETAVREAVARLVQERESEKRGCFMFLMDWTVLPILHIFNMLLPAETLTDKVFKLTEEIQDLQKEKYDACAVFVTFETESGQRSALSALAASTIDIARNNTHSVAPSTVFQDRVLEVIEPSEPNAVRWLDLHVSSLRKLIIRLINLAMTVGMIGFAAFLVQKTRQGFGPRISGPVVTALNAIVPFFVRILMIFERHKTEGSWQKSLYLKVTLFRWTNTAIIAAIASPHIATLGWEASDQIPFVTSLLWSELIIAPALRLIDPLGNTKKHIIAPRTRNQESMNLNFQGTIYNLGERYTDFTKVLFLCFFYSALFPPAFFFGAAILIVQYYVDKFLLMRVWASAPFIGNDIAVFSRRYFISGALLAMAIVSSYVYAQFPYDNVCDPPEGTVTNFTPGIYTLTNLDGETFNKNVTEDAVYCSQRAVDGKGPTFPALPSWQREGLEWMTDSQETTVSIYGWTSVVVLGIFVVAVFGGTVFYQIRSLFQGSYESKGTDQQIDFSSENQEIFAFVPQIKYPGYPYPFLACDIDQIDGELVGWTDRDNPRDYHNVIYDVPWEGMPRKRSETVPDSDESKEAKGRPVFSIIKHYPPEWKKGNS